MVNVTVEGLSKSDIIYSNRQLDLKQENVIHQYMKLVYSECIRPEKPINIVINKQYLKDIACDIFYKDFRKE